MVCLAAGDYARDGDLPPTLQALPGELLCAIIGHLPPGAVRCPLRACSSGLKAHVDTVDSEERQLRAGASLPPTALASWLPRFPNVRRLSLERQATDAIAGALTAVLSASVLENLVLASSPQLTDQAMEMLAAHISAGNGRRLQEIDLTFCNSITFGACISLRHAAGGRVHIRRLPDWHCGRFHTPWGEVHTYYADGSFEFDRSTQSAGYVRWCRRVSSPRAAAPASMSPSRTLCDTRHVNNSLQYVDFSPPPPWPNEVRFIYRPGVALLPLAQRSGGSPTDHRRVLVVQDMRSVAAPARIPPVLIRDIDPGTRHYALPNGVLADASLDEYEAQRQGYHYRISCMEVEPLTREEMQAPASLVARIERFEQQRRLAGHREDLLEGVLFSGLRDQHPSEPWQEEPDDAASIDELPLE